MNATNVTPLQCIPETTMTRSLRPRSVLAMAGAPLGSRAPTVAFETSAHLQCALYFELLRLAGRVLKQYSGKHQ